MIHAVKSDSLGKNKKFILRIYGNKYRSLCTCPADKSCSLTKGENEDTDWTEKEKRKISTYSAKYTFKCDEFPKKLGEFCVFTSYGKECKNVYENAKKGDKGFVWCQKVNNENKGNNEDWEIGQDRCIADP